MLLPSRRTLLPALLLLLLVTLVATLSMSAGATDVSSDVTSSETWNMAGSPYVIKANVVVQNGVTLTINPGVDVKFAGFYSLEAAATGKILAQGTAAMPVNFTSSDLDPGVGDWDHLGTGAGGKLVHCNIMHSTVAAYVDAGGIVQDSYVRASTTGIVLRGAGATVKDTRIVGLQVGIGFDSVSNAVAQRCQVELCDQAINLLGTTDNALVEGCFINSSSTHGVAVTATGGGNRVRDSIIARSPTGVLLTGMSSVTGGLLVFNCTIEFSSTQGVFLESVSALNAFKFQRLKVWDCNVGFYALSSSNFEVTECTFRDNNKGVRVEECAGYTATFHKNNLIKNSNVDAESVNSEVLWDFAGFGNFWWRAIYEYGFSDGNGDGIADQEWSLTGLQKDHFPLMKPVDFEDPVADAGPNIKVKQHRSLDLDGSRSEDDTWIANYTWTIELPEEDLVVYGEKPKLTLDVAGVFKVILRVADALGHADSDTIELNVTDADSPVFAAHNTPSVVGAGEMMTFTSNITDNIRVTEAWVIYRFGLTGQNTRLDLEYQYSDIWKGTLLVPVSLNQKVYYTMSARDAENNIVRSGEKEITVADITPPWITPALGANVTTGDFNWVNVTVIDNRQVEWVTVEYWFGSGGAHETLNMSMQGTLWVTEVDVPRDAPSPLNLVFTAVDASNNINVSSQFSVPVVDNDPPVVNLDSTTHEIHKGEQAEIRAIINDNIAIETAFVEVKYPPETDYDATPLEFDGEYWIGVINVKSTGVRIYYHFRITDTSGNVLVTEDTERLMLSQRPHISTDPPTEAWEGQEYSVDFDADDPDNEDYEHQWSMTTNATWLVIDVVEGVVSGTPADEHVGWYWVNITVQDPDGVDDWLYYEVVVHDVNSAPEVSITSPPDGQKVGTILKVSGRATDDLDEIVWVRIRIDEGAWENVTGTKTWSYEVSVKKLKAGTHFISAKSFDGISESRVDEISFIVPKRDDGDDSPGFGGLAAAIALMAATSVAIAIRSARRRY